MKNFVILICFSKLGSGVVLSIFILDGVHTQKPQNADSITWIWHCTQVIVVSFEIPVSHLRIRMEPNCSNFLLWLVFPKEGHLISKHLRATTVTGHPPIKWWAEMTVLKRNVEYNGSYIKTESFWWHDLDVCFLCLGLLLNAQPGNI